MRYGSGLLTCFRRSLKSSSSEKIMGWNITIGEFDVEIDWKDRSAFATVKKHEADDAH